VPADQVTAAARASTCAYSTVASKFVTNYQVDKIKEESSRSCSIIATILEPTIFLAPLPGKRQSISDCCFSSIFHYNLLLSSLFHFHYAISFLQK